MVFTYCSHYHFVLCEILYICFAIPSWLYSCAGGKLVLYVAEEMSNMRNQGGMPLVILELRL